MRATSWAIVALLLCCLIAISLSESPKRTDSKAKTVSQKKKPLSLAALKALAARPKPKKRPPRFPITRILLLNQRALGAPPQAREDAKNFARAVAYPNRWTATSLKLAWTNSRPLALKYIAKRKPSFMMLPLRRFLELQSKYELEFIGSASTSKTHSWMSSSSRFYVVSLKAKQLSACRKKTLSSSHFGDMAYLRSVVESADFKLDDFLALPVRKHLASVQQLMGEDADADCALVDNIELQDALQLAGTEKLKVLWQSKYVPSVIVAAFPQVSAGAQFEFTMSLPKICSRQASRSACKDMGINFFRAPTKKSKLRMKRVLTTFHKFAASARLAAHGTSKAKRGKNGKKHKHSKRKSSKKRFRSKKHKKKKQKKSKAQKAASVSHAKK